MTEWDEFVALDYQKIYELMSKPAFIFDGMVPLFVPSPIDAAMLIQPCDCRPQYSPPRRAP